MQVKYKASLNELGDMLQFIHNQSISAGFDENSASKIELALEEALVNIIKYAYKEDGKSEIIVDCDISPQGLKIVLKDKGPAFNPLTQGPKIRNDIAVEEKPIGGYGIYLIRKIMDTVDYEYKDQSNILILTKSV